VVAAAPGPEHRGGATDVLSSLTFLTPSGGLIALVGLLPLAALGISNLRAALVARVLRLRPAPRRSAVAPAALVAAAFLVFGLVAAQPAWRTDERHRARTTSEVFFVVDVSRSMAAADRVSGPTRLDRARGLVLSLRAAVPAVPAGLAGLTDRVLPYLFPTLDDVAFTRTAQQSLTIESPPPQQVSTNATSFGALVSLARDGFFTRTAEHRTCVLVTDGETRSYATSDVIDALGSTRGCRLVVVRVGRAGERVFGPDGLPEAAYAPDPTAADRARALAEATGGQVFSEDDVGAAAAALRQAADVGPEGSQQVSATNRALGPYAAGLAALVVLILLAGRFRLHRIFTEA
jgi:hypothetical protein